MDPLEAALLGLVEGLTEYLPVSSTGHLILTQRLLGIEAGEAANSFSIAIQGGAILAVLFALRERTRQLAAGLVGRDGVGQRLCVALLVAFVPAAALGLAFDDWIEARLFGLVPIVAAWAVGGVGILVLSRWLRARRSGGLGLDELRWKGALAIGLFQCLALWPGTSRSLATLAGGLLAGLSLAAAVEFSFLLGVLTLGAASSYAALKSGAVMLETYGLAELVLGWLVAFGSALIAVRWLMAWVRTRDLALFGWYRLALAFVVGLWLWSGGGT
ncbi:MAG: undecaprenyl-diphosphate phosphatase [Planctomycetes bacterium]|nr:undecaprenyl-diphosphate phosphatase [Planctomycetota bacterium]